MYDKISIGKRIKDIQEDSNLDIETFATRLGYKNSQSFYNITSGRAGISLEVLWVLATEFGVDINWLILGYTQPTKGHNIAGDGNVVIGGVGAKHSVTAEVVQQNDDKTQILEQRIKDLEALLSAQAEIISLLKSKV
jgi:transcriptional regulator with XRE-family HTH domain